jgi:hypothetical protein
MADFVLNNADLESLEKEVEQLHKLILENYCS